MQHSPFQIRGVIEGFYGPFYTFPERNDLIAFIGQHGYNLYIYGPKNDRQHRHRWSEPYPPEIMAQFAQTAALAQQVGVTFCYAISPLSYDPDQDFEKLAAKLRDLYDCGVRAFSYLMDDIACATHHAVNCRICDNYGRLHAQVCNRLFDWLHALDPACTLSMCPTHYHGVAPFSGYLHDLGALLNPGVDVFYTGPDVCSATITASHAQDFAQAVRRPPLIWDNYPVNDLAMRANLHIGPLRGRDAALHTAVRGMVFNLMLQAEASKIPLLTIADYLDAPQQYDPWRSWERALSEVGGQESCAALRAFAEHSLDSCLASDAPSQLKRLTEATVAALQKGVACSVSQAVHQLTQYLSSLDEACYFLKHRMPNLRLRENILPWIEALEDWIWLGKHALATLELLEQGGAYEQRLSALKESLNLIARHSKRSGGQDIFPLALYTLEYAEDYRMRHGQSIFDTTFGFAALDLLDRAPEIPPQERYALSGIPAN
ncbi:MAG TPA: protein O-GlcNAcase [Herpetosiphonaceae bacterium]